MKIVKSGPFRVRLSAEKEKQDGNVPSRRHILGSKIFKEQLLETFGKIIFFKKKLKFFFEKKYFFRKSHNAEKLKKRPFRLIKRFYKPKTSKKMQLIDSENFRKKSRIVMKKNEKNQTKRNKALVSHLLLEA